MWNPSLFFILQNTKQFWPLKNDHIITEFSWFAPWHRPCPVLTSCGDLQHHSGHRQNDWTHGVFAISDNTKLILGLCNMNEWWRWHRSQTLARFGCNFVCHATFLQSNSKLYVQKNNYVPNSPVEFAQCNCNWFWLNGKLEYNMGQVTRQASLGDLKNIKQI